MKNILFILGFSCLASVVSAQNVLDAKHNIKGSFIFSDETMNLTDKEGKTLCTFHQDGRILDPKAATLGFIVEERELQDKNHKTVAYLLNDGTVQNEKHDPIGHVNMNGSGPVMDQTSNVIGFIERIEPYWGAAYFFLLKF